MRHRKITSRLVLPVAFVFAALPAAAQGGGASGDVSDADLLIALEREYAGAQALSPRYLDLECAEGVVTLTGNVPDILAKERAVRIAKQTRGVVAVVDRLQVAMGDPDDERLAERVRDALVRDPATSGWQVGVTVENGAVTLTGSVDSFAERELAAKVAKGVQSVRALDNGLTVHLDAQRPDREVEEEIQRLLAMDVRVDAGLVDVSAEDGEVELTGEVGSAYERDLARRQAWVAGVRSVNTEGLEVVWWRRDEMRRDPRLTGVDDDAVHEAVVAAMRRDPRVLSFHPDVRVESGRVTLTGEVTDLKARRAAEQDAQNTVGVRRVTNLLKVRPDVERSDDQIRGDVTAALSDDVLLGRRDLRVTVRDGEVFLYGDVDSWFESAQASDVAAKVRGVTDVHSRLDVDYEPSRPLPSFADWDPLLYDYDFDHRTTRAKTDREIEEDIEAQLWWSPFVDEDEVNVRVEDGVATLTGVVDARVERRSAAENALEGGAWKVVNRLEVELGS